LYQPQYRSKYHPNNNIRNDNPLICRGRQFGDGGQLKWIGRENGKIVKDVRVLGGGGGKGVLSCLGQWAKKCIYIYW